MPTLSVVVPMYNVGRYLEDCLRSLQVQTYRDLDVVMVDDGSWDDTPQIAERFAAEDSRFRLVRQENGGLGAARNTGTRNASGDFITFVDGDDVIPPHAFGAHIASLHRTGSDFSSGNVMRLGEVGTWQSPMHRVTFAAPDPATHISRRETLLTDRLATNKVWRRAFWDASGQEFPTGVLYEDIPVVIPLHFQASSVDVLDVPVYFWRERPSDDRSITQDRMRPGAMEDRFTAVGSVARFLQNRGQAEDKRRWDTIALRSDLRIFIQLLDEANEEFTRLFLKLGQAYLETVDEPALEALPAIERLKWHLVRRGMAAELREAVAFSKSVAKPRAPAVRHGLRFYASYPYKDDAQRRVPRSVYRLGSELYLRQKAETAEWQDGRLVVSGRVCLHFLRPNRRIQQSVRAWAVEQSSGARVRLPVAVHRANEFTLPAGYPTARQDWGGYQVTIDPKPLLAASSDPEAQWGVELRVVNRGMTRTGWLGFPVEGPLRRVGPEQVAPGVWLRTEWHRGIGLILIVDRHAIPVEAEGSAGEGLTLRLPAGEAEGKLLLRTEEADRELRLPLQADGEGAQARVSWQELSEGFEDRRRVAGCAQREEWWLAELERPDGERIRLCQAPDEAPRNWRSNGLEVTAEQEYSGWFRLRVRRPAPVVTEVRWQGTRLHLAGEYHASVAPGEELSLVVRAAGRVEEHEIPLRRSNSHVECDFDPAAVPGYGASTPLYPGTYTLLVRTTEPDHSYTDVTAQLFRPLAAAMPSSAESAEYEISADVRGDDAILLRIGSVLRLEDRGSYAQQLLREVTYPKLQEEPVTPGVVFESYSGKQYSDSPRGIQEELAHRGTALPATWIVRERQVPLPGGVRAVPYGSRDYVEALARMQYVVTNAHLPPWFVKRPGQTVLQTWHGSMLKRIGFDMDNLQSAIGDYHDRLRRETAQWDYLVSPSPWATPILRRAFRFEGEILETGYPRNDIFFAPDREQIAARVRQRLGIPEGRRVILYAPTWRDDKFYAPGRYKLDLHLDLWALREQLGEDHVLLFRRHPNIVDRVPSVGGDFVYDVSTYPEIQELFLVADVLVTDYSSLMFDFANTGRPMLFFTYDLEEYRDSLRGFYFDFEEQAPGPLLQTSEEVGSALADLAGDGNMVEDFQDRYADFRKQFCPLDDGGAAARIVDRIWSGA